MPPKRKAKVVNQLGIIAKNLMMIKGMIKTDYMLYATIVREYLGRDL